MCLGHEMLLLHGLHHVAVHQVDMQQQRSLYHADAAGALVAPGGTLVAHVVISWRPGGTRSDQQLAPWWHT